jgi:lipopolysaccharide/colanic/teichoic acid biosynthesis glycosyltransferase
MSGTAQRFTSRISTQEANGVLSEDDFMAALNLERKRTERSGNAFLLALFRLSPADHASNLRNDMIKVVVPTIRPVLRDTDVVGWYQSNDVLGVVLTQCHGEPKTKAKSAVDKKLRDVLALSASDTLPRLTISYHFYPDDIGELTSDSAPLQSMNQAHPGSGGAQYLKRAIDIAGSLMIMPVLLPLFVIIGIMIKLNSKGPIVFRQTRVGRGGKVFSFLKFRSMYDKNDPTIHREYVTGLIAGRGVAAMDGTNKKVFKLVGDPRITSVGRILRKSSLDELPQLFNVLMGDMSLVGPRPPVPYEFERYAPWHRQRVMQVKPGITGLWQVSGRCRTTFDEMVRLDLRYARSWSIWLDLKILLRTPAAVFSGEGAH